MGKVMPTYLVTTANVKLTASQKQQIAEAITMSHCEATGAPGYFAQVIFCTLEDGDHFIGGWPNKSAHVFISGFIRAGRSTDSKRALIERAVPLVARIAAADPQDIWIYLQDIEAEQMAEFGRILPKPGAEVEWRRGLNPRKQAQLIAAGVPIPPSEAT
jgi:phenylpyruvate tautomerase PptA (4-oxalocrotonate tautomerase family)